jgi:hypothetical protein
MRKWPAEILDTRTFYAMCREIISFCAAIISFLRWGVKVASEELNQAVDHEQLQDFGPSRLAKTQIDLIRKQTDRSS